MPSLFLLTPGTRAGLCGERLAIEMPPQDPGEPKGLQREVPLRDIEQVIYAEHVALTTPALAELMRRNIPVVLTGHGESVLGLCHPPAPHSIARLAQYRHMQDPAFVQRCAGGWVEAKIVNSRRMLQRLAANRRQARVDDALAELASLAQKCRQAETLDTLRGYEGTAAGRYFEVFGSFFPETCPFERRSRRPPHNAANAILSYAYTLLGVEMECQLHAVGLDPALGLLHEPTDRRPSLALDMIEPFRAPVADALALDLLSHSILQPDLHFENRDGGVYMDMSGKKRFFVAYERRMEREYLSEQAQRHTTLRGELHRQALAFKQMVLGNGEYVPFIMN